ncbi:MAG: ELM1/GtrOC1 family putative glycosyltransferase [Candidatus Omnitrophota bacterium]|nr:ELM1/GtrOC1 family putative glycosyltransferase [Candidatus Omnitrophota bacterium]
MATNNSFKESCLPAVLKGLGVVLRALPFGAALGLARIFGAAGYYFLPAKRRVAYGNVKTAFGGKRSPEEIDRIVKKAFQGLACSFVEFLWLPKIKRLGSDRFVTQHGMENIHAAMARGKGVILLAVHFGSWELANIVGSSWGYPYNMVANEQPKTPALNIVVNEYRRMTGAKLIAPGAAIRGVVKALRANEIVTLVLDQGGTQGIPVPFLGKTASMSTGAVRLALKYGAALVPAWIVRAPDGHHDLRLFPAMDLVVTGNMEQDVITNTRAAVKLIEALIDDCPDQYLWFYKVYKYTTQHKTVILDDGKTGHLRQSQAAARALASVLRSRGKDMEEVIVPVVFKSRLAGKICVVFAGLSQFFVFLRNERWLRFFLTKESYRTLLSHKPDSVISCGSTTGGVNFICAASNQAKSVSILKSGLVKRERFDLSILPRHDKPDGKVRGRCVFTKAAPNLITPQYLKVQEAGLLAVYPHLKANARLKIGVMLGGDAKGVAYDAGVIHQLLRQLKEVAGHFNAELLVTTSRRTPADVDALVARDLKNFEYCALCVIANKQNVPQAVGGILSLSDIVVVSGESVSMVSEALSSGKRTIVFAPQGAYGPSARNKYDRFVLDLSDEGYLMAVSVKEISAALNDMIRNKFSPKAIDDQGVVCKALEEII